MGERRDLRSASLGFPPRVALMGPPDRAQPASTDGVISDRTRGGRSSVAPAKDPPLPHPAPIDHSARPDVVS